MNINSNPKFLRLRIRFRSFLNSHKSKFSKNTGQFSRRIRLRHNAFWSAPDSELVRNTIMHANDPIEKWKDIENWQRKLSNKYNSREFAKKHGCKVARLYWSGRDVNTIDFDNLPKQFVVRPTTGHSCKKVFLIDEGINLMDGKRYSNEAIKEILAADIVKDSHLQFLVEEFVRNEQGEYKVPVDYKFFMFDGEVAIILVINRLMPPNGLGSYYNTDWKRMKTINNSFPNDADQKRPECLDEMIECAKKLSKAYETFVRIDFYATDKGAVFGEFTPTPGNGKNFTAYGEKLLGDYWNRFYKEKI